MKPQYSFIRIMRLSIVFFTIILISSCKKDDSSSGDTPSPTPNPPPSGEVQYSMGLTGTDDMSKVPTTINFFGAGQESFPVSFSMLEKFPPIGDQGKYGTCVAWAVGYNCKTVINGIEKSLSKAQLGSTANQFSPKDLFTAIADDKKGGNCNGTNFESAFDILQNRGIATMQAVPYENMGNCTQNSLNPSWTQAASANKISYYRKVDPSVNAIKKYIVQNIPVVFGARLSDGFMTLRSDAVISSHTTFDKVGMHAGHALIISGYDDKKGPNGAFQVVNSWSTGWGATGICWIDYNFFLNEFVMGQGNNKCLFIAANQAGKDNNPPTPQPTPNTNGIDLAPWIFGDMPNAEVGGTARTVGFNIFNIGNTSASATGWCFYYIYYNAYNANDYKIIFINQFASEYKNNDGTVYSLQPGQILSTPDGSYSIVNLNIAAGGSIHPQGVHNNYMMPPITGQYYLIGIVEPDNRILPEQNKMNNIFYTSLTPGNFNQGIIYGSTRSSAPLAVENKLRSKSALLSSEHHSAVTPDFKNAYTQQEILEFLKQEKTSGRLDKKLNEFRKQKGALKLNANFFTPTH